MNEMPAATMARPAGCPPPTRGDEMTETIQDWEAWARARGATGPPDECWPWTGGIQSAGYGMSTVKSRPLSNLAHRAVYEILVGPIPEGMTLDHICHNRDRACPGKACIHRRCVNPAHLEVVTRGENARRGLQRGIPTYNSLKTHCKRGHPLSGANLYVIPSTGVRQCRTCRRLRYHKVAS